jgi:hypothetical protein
MPVLVASEPSPRRVRSRTTKTTGPSRKRERPGGCPVSQYIGAVSAEQESVRLILRRLGTEPKSTSGVCALSLELNVTASARRSAGIGDGPQPHHIPRARRAAIQSANPRRDVTLAQARTLLAWDRSDAVSHAAIAAVLRLEDVSAGERLTAFSLASFANREHRAWPGTPVAAARAGLSRSQYLAARDGLAQRGLLHVDDPGGGRGHSPVVSLRFAESGPWCDAEVNPGLVEAMLSYSRTGGSARVLLATLAAVADQHGTVTGLSAEEIQAAAGMADSTYRRARATLLDSGELVLATAGGGRARTNRWQIPDPSSINPEAVAAARPRPMPRPGTRPLLATTRPPRSAAEDQLGLLVEAVAGERKGPGLSGVSAANPVQNRRVSRVKGPGWSGVSTTNPGQSRTVCGETPPQTPPETPPPNARKRREPQNPRIRNNPPNPPDGGSHQLVSIVETHITPRGRQRQQTVTVDLDEIRSQLLSPSHTDHTDWQQVQAAVESAVGTSTFTIWLAALQLIARDDGGTLLLACPPATRRWVAGRFAAVLERVGRSHGRGIRLATDRELQLLNALTAAGAKTPDGDALPHHHQEAV